MNHVLQAETNRLFTLFRTWLRRQFTQPGHKKNTDELAMHLLARSQGVATMANAIHDERFIKQEVKQICDWLNLSTESASHDADNQHGAG